MRDDAASVSSASGSDTWWTKPRSLRTRRKSDLYALIELPYRPPTAGAFMVYSPSRLQDFAGAELPEKPVSAFRDRVLGWCSRSGVSSTEAEGLFAGNRADERRLSRRHRYSADRDGRRRDHRLRPDRLPLLQQGRAGGAPTGPGRGRAPDRPRGPPRRAGRGGNARHAHPYRNDR